MLGGFKLIPPLYQNMDTELQFEARWIHVEPTLSQRMNRELQFEARWIHVEPTSVSTHGQRGISLILASFKLMLGCFKLMLARFPTTKTHGSAADTMPSLSELAMLRTQPPTLSRH